MEVLAIVGVLLVVCVALSGPVALIISIISLNKTRGLSDRLKTSASKPVQPPPVAAVAPQVQKPEPVGLPIETASKPAMVRAEEPAMSLEALIGTRWILYAGIVTSFVAVGFFLKYAYDNALIGPLGRVIISAACGLGAVAVGEITRRRNYDIVAKGVTALGFAILYATVFSANRYYHLIETTPAFVLAVMVTAAAMLYAVSLDEIVVALLALLGGFLTPVVVSTGQNLPMQLFSYVLILTFGAICCAWYRKWRAVDVLAFAGTFILYTAWFEKFYRPQMGAALTALPEQTYIALGWLTVFFAVFLVLPLFHELLKKIKAREEDILLVLSNAAIVFYYLWTILFDRHRHVLAFCAFGLCAAHLAMLSVVAGRCGKDINLKLVLLAISLFFFTMAIPLRLGMNATAMAWAAEAVVLAIIAIRYRSPLTHIAAGIALVLSAGRLLYSLPMHAAVFRPVFNPTLGTWLFVAAAIFVCHLLYRRRASSNLSFAYAAEILYAAWAMLLMTAVSMEWWHHCDYNLDDMVNGRIVFVQWMILIFTVFILLLSARPLRPAGQLNNILATLLAGGGSFYTVFAVTELYKDSFTIFINSKFLIVMVFAAGIFLAAWLLFRDREDLPARMLGRLFALGATVLVWVLINEQLYLY